MLAVLSILIHVNFLYMYKEKEQPTNQRRYKTKQTTNKKEKRETFKLMSRLMIGPMLLDGWGSPWAYPVSMPCTAAHVVLCAQWGIL